MELSRQQCDNIKGYAILLIVVHNFVDHLLGIHCNEMAYSQANTDAFLSGVFSSAAVWQLFSFAGWVGVVMFLFLSGYGLMRKYGTAPIQPCAYAKSHLAKLWRLLVPVYLLYFVIYHYGFQQDHNWQSVIAQLTFTINLLDYGKNCFLTEPGVYWFFGAILQFYLLFLAIRRLDNRWLWFIVALSLTLNHIVIYTFNADASWWVRQNAIGWMVPFVMGMLAARMPMREQQRRHQLSINVVLCIVALIMLSICLVIKALAPFTEVFTILFFVALTGIFSSRIIAYCGAISASLFVIHPFVRMICYHYFSTSQLSTIAMVAIYLIAVFVLSGLHQLIMKRYSTR